jgi:RsiW-degrading membrane proteinase PrsW (M82 family)
MDAAANVPDLLHSSWETYGLPLLAVAFVVGGLIMLLWLASRKPPD